MKNEQSITMQLENTLSVDTRPVEMMITARHWPDLFISEMKSIMQLHGGRLEENGNECVFHFPIGTIKRAILPTSLYQHYCIIFPDGFCIMYHQLLRGSDTLVFPMDAFSLELQAKYPSL